MNFWGQLRRILCVSYVVSQAETFNYKTNYEAASVPPLTQPGPEQDRADSGAQEQLRRRQI